MSDSKSFEIDSIFTIGRTHRVAEDYALHNNDEFPIIILSDGCSSVRHADIGSRILTHCAYRILKSSYEDGCIENLLFNSNLLGRSISSESIKVAKVFGVDAICLSATLLIGCIVNDKLLFTMFGDGTYSYLDIDNNINTITQDYSTTDLNNIPYYIAYYLDGIDSSYVKSLKNRNADLNSILSITSNSGDVIYKPFNFVPTISLDINNIKHFSMYSDGVSQFSQINNRSTLNMESVVAESTKFKSYRGEFVQRRVNKMLSTFASSNIYPLDDFSMGSIINTNNM